MRSWEVALGKFLKPWEESESLRRLCSRELRTENAEALISYVLARMGGFSIRWLETENSIGI